MPRMTQELHAPIATGRAPGRALEAPSGGDGSADDFGVKAPALSLPKGGGAIRGIGEKFAANPVTGTGSMSVPIATPPGRDGFGPRLALRYDSGSGNGLFGLGWSLALGSIARRTDRGLPRYVDSADSDVFVLAGAEDLVPVDGGPEPVTVHQHGCTAVRRYRPRVEADFALIERWTDEGEPRQRVLADRSAGTT